VLSVRRVQKNPFLLLDKEEVPGGGNLDLIFHSADDPGVRDLAPAPGLSTGRLLWHRRALPSATLNKVMRV